MTTERIEVFLMFWTMLGFSADLWNIYHVVADRWKVLRRRVNAGREFALRDEIRRALINGAANAAFVVISLVALWTPNRPQPERTALQTGLLLLFLCVPLLLAGQALCDVFARRKLQQHYVPNAHERRSGRDRRHAP